MDQVVRFRIERDYVEFALISALRAWPDQHVAPHEVAAPLIPFVQHVL